MFAHHTARRAFHAGVSTQRFAAAVDRLAVGAYAFKTDIANGLTVTAVIPVAGQIRAFGRTRGGGNGTLGPVAAFTKTFRAGFT